MEALGYYFAAASGAAGLFMLTAAVVSLLAGGQRRAALKMIYLTVGYAVVWIALLQLVVTRLWPAGIALGLPILWALWLTARPRSLNPLSRLPSAEPFDRRDTVFSRMQLHPGTAEYRRYYARHPEKKGTDDCLREMPPVGSPESPAYRPESALLTRACFSAVAHIAKESAPTESTGSLPRPANAASVLKEVGRRAGAALVGIARLDRGDIYLQGHGEVDTDEEMAVVYAVPMDYQAVASAPGPRSMSESALGYLRAATVGRTLTSAIRQMGHSAHLHANNTYLAVLPPLAVRAGLGEIGRIGLLVTEGYGPRVRLGAVTTGLPLAPDRPVSFGLQEYCRRCGLCAAFCPGEAISRASGPRKHRGVKKWTVNPERCYEYWRKIGTDCGVCLKVCPYARPDDLLHRALRRAVRNRPAAARLAVKIDELLYRRRPEFRKDG